MTTRSVLGGLLFLGLFLVPATAGEKPKATGIGEKTPNGHALRDLRGNRRAAA